MNACRLPDGSLHAGTLDIEKVAALLQTNITEGLNESQVQSRTHEFGPNDFDVQDKETLLHKYLDQVWMCLAWIFGLAVAHFTPPLQFKNPLIIMLLVSASVSVLMGQMDDALSITVVWVSFAFFAFVTQPLACPTFFLIDSESQHAWMCNALCRDITFVTGYSDCVDGCVCARVPQWEEHWGAEPTGAPYV
jgi:hypothetical protein